MPRPLERRLSAALEPVVGQVCFAPECHAAYEALGFDAGTRRARDVQLPDGPAYFGSRGSLLGQVPGEVVASAFGVFSPAVVVPGVRRAWSLADAPTIRAARTVGAVAQLRRVLGDSPVGLDRVRDLIDRAAASADQLAGRPLASGIASLSVPGDPLAAVWHLGDLLREYRGDGHTAAWVAARVHRLRDRVAHRALLGVAVALVQPHEGLDGRGVRRRRGTPVPRRVAHR
jgi:hypothetical protein